MNIRFPVCNQMLETQPVRNYPRKRSIFNQFTHKTCLRSQLRIKKYAISKHNRELSDETSWNA